MPDDRTQVNVRLSEEQHERWKDYVEDSEEYRHLSELIRHSVQKEIEDTDSDDTAAQTAMTDGNVGEVIDALERLSGRFDNLEATVESAAEEIRSEGNVPDAVLTAVFEELPESPIKAKTPAEIADAADVSEREASLALAQLRRETGDMVDFMKEEGSEEPVYWRAKGGGE